jgi:hypothetical protein
LGNAAVRESRDTAVKSAVDSYSDVDRPIHPLRWLDEIPAMAEEWRAKEATLFDEAAAA